MIRRHVVDRPLKRIAPVDEPSIPNRESMATRPGRGGYARRIVPEMQDVAGSKPILQPSGSPVRDDGRRIAESTVDGMDRSAPCERPTRDRPARLRPTPGEGIEGRALCGREDVSRTFDLGRQSLQGLRPHERSRRARTPDRTEKTSEREYPGESAPRRATRAQAGAEAREPRRTRREKKSGGHGRPRSAGPARPEVAEAGLPVFIGRELRLTGRQSQRGSN